MSKNPTSHPAAPVQPAPSPAFIRATSRKGPWSFKIMQIDAELGSVGGTYRRMSEKAADRKLIQAERELSRRCACRARLRGIELLEEAAACLLDTSEARSEMNILLERVLSDFGLDDPEVATQVSLIERNLDGKASPIPAKPRRRLAIVAGKDVMA